MPPAKKPADATIPPISEDVDALFRLLDGLRERHFAVSAVPVTVGRVQVVVTDEHPRRLLEQQGKTRLPTPDDDLDAFSE